ncbi:hypothetical protein GCM10020221_15190 [Streptomyces thioluteus]|uniref:Uncharacterized protein n=1 Tax=Streptomyces thioluteus TaxID=66431 RepID=A0ABN3WLY6_STRTU
MFAGVVLVDAAHGLGAAAGDVVGAAGDDDVAAAEGELAGVLGEELVQVDVHGRLVVPDALELPRGQAGVEHVAEVVPHPVVDTALAGLLVGEVDLRLGDGHAVDPAPEPRVRHDARPATPAPGVQQPLPRRHRPEMIEEDVGLRGLQPVQLLDDPRVPRRLVTVEHGRVVIPQPVVMVVETIDITQPQIDRVLLVVPVLGHRLLIRSTQNRGHGCRAPKKKQVDQAEL